MRDEGRGEVIWGEGDTGKRCRKWQEKKKAKRREGKIRMKRRWGNGDSRKGRARARGK